MNSIVWLALAGLLLTQAPALASEITGSVSGHPVPRFMSLRPSDTPVREGPSKDHRIKWVFKREGVPVEVIAEFENWRRVRDSEGEDGWVFKSRLSLRRTAQVSPRARDRMFSIHARDNEQSPVVARLEPGVVGDVERCTGRWCRISGQGFEGWIQQERLWGVYPNEPVLTR
jgi:SH3-like domain-containing protein